MKQYHLFCILLTGLSLPAFGQSCDCLEDECGDIISSYTIAGDQTVVCDGFEFTVLNTSPAVDYDYFVWDWGDGTLDTTFTTESISHTYNIPDSLVCEDDKTNFFICLTVYRECGTGISCHNTRQPVGVVHRPLAQFDAENALCQDDELGVQNASCNADTYSWDFGNGFTSTEENPNYIYPDTGPYTISLSVANECASDSYTQSVSIVEPPVAAFETGLAQGDSLCAPASLSLANLNDQLLTASVWSIFPNDTANWVFQDSLMTVFSDEIVISLLQPGLFEIGITAQNACGSDMASLTLPVYDLPFVNLNAPEVFCDSAVVTLSTLGYEAAGDINTYTWLFTNGDIPSADTEDFGSVVFYESGEVSLSVGGPCDDVSDAVPITVAGTEAITLGNNPSALCQSSPDVQLQAGPAGGIWSGPGNAISESGVLSPGALTPGTYTFTYSTGAGACENEAAVEVVIEPDVAVTLQDVPTGCESLAVQPDPGYSGTGLTYCWFYLDEGDCFSTDSLPGDIVLNGPGSRELAVLVSGTCGTAADTVSLSVQAAVEVEAVPIDEPLCSGSGPVNLQVNADEGQWVGPGISDPADGVFDPGSVPAGVYSLAYVIDNGACTDSDTITVEVVDSEAVLFPDTSYCVDAGIQQLFASPGTGVWSGGGVTASGAFDPEQAEAGPNAITYTYVDGNNCEVVQQAEVFVAPLPQAGFSIDGSPCIGSAFTFQDGSALASSYSWDFGDGGQSSEASPGYSYTTPGTYTVTLGVTSAFGCEAQKDTVLYITTPPVAEFALAETEGCAPFGVSLVNTSYGDSIQQFWQLEGDTLFGPQLSGLVLDSITTDSIFDLILTVSNFCGPDTQMAQILVHPYPQASFGISEDEGCSPLEVSFANATVGNADSYQWQMGNGLSVSDSLPPPQLYTTPDTAVSVYEVRLVAENECGIDTVWQDITVFPPDIDAFIQLDTLSGCSPLEVQLQNFSTPGARNSWQVIAPSGAISGSEQPNPVVVLQEPGLHTIVLYASGCGQDTDTAFIEVLPAPEPVMSLPATACMGEVVAFAHATPDVGGIFWDFGDGQNSTLPAPEAAYDSAGQYTVSLTVYSLADNCPATRTETITILGRPQAAFAPSQVSGCSPLSVAFANTSQGEGALNFVWDFMDGTSASFEAEPVHTFEVPGQYPVRLSVTDELGCFGDTTFFNITVHPDPVSSFFIPEQLYCLGVDTLFLQNQSEGAVAYEWDIFGEMSTLVAPISSLPEAGASIIELTAISANGCRDTSAREIEVLNSPVAGFAFGPDAGCQGLAVDFENASQWADTYSWDFGNGNSSTQLSPAQTFDEAGSYAVRLVALSFNGCPADTLVETVTVYPAPVAGFVFEQPEACGVPRSVLFENTSTGNIDNRWSFGEGSTSAGTSPLFTYTSPGAFSVGLIVENEFGCLDTLVQEVDILGRPEAALAFSNTQGCEPLYVEIDNLSEQAAEYVWLIESRPPFTVDRPSFVLSEPGQYDVTLVAIYNEACRDTLQLADALTVYPSPTADFDYTIDPLESRLGEVLFFNYSRQANRFLWDFGDGFTTTAFEPLHEFNFNDRLPVTLTAYNDNGGVFLCQHDTTIFLQPEWINTFHAPNAFSPDYGAGDVRVFKPVGIGVDAITIRVYAPYGEQVWHSEEVRGNQPAGAWDGTYKGEPLPQGAYTWIADLTFLNGERRRATGTVTLLR